MPVRRRDVLFLLIPLAVFYALWIALSLAVRTLPSWSPLAGILPLLATLIHMGGATLAMVYYLDVIDRRLHESQHLRLPLLIGFLVVGVGLAAFSQWNGRAPAPFFEMIGTANLLALAMVLGGWMATALKRPAELVPVCLVMSLVDLFSVVRGPTRIIADSVESFYLHGRQGTPPLGDFLLVKVGVPGVSIPLPVFGVTDWIIVVFLSAAALRFGYNDNLFSPGKAARWQGRWSFLSLPVAATGLAVAVLMAQLGGVFLPALPVVALVFMLYLFARYPASRQLQSSDWTLMLTSCGVMALLMFLPLF